MEPTGEDNNGAAELLLPQLARLEVSGNGTAQSSEPSTPIESPQTLDNDLRDWLNAALSAAATNPKVYTKLLVSNAAAGSIIGKGGGNINDFQQKTYAKIQLSKASEYFPGTVERILMLTGRLKQVIAALNLIFSKLSKEGVAPLSPKSKAAAVGGGGSSSGSSSSAQQPPAEAPPGLRLLVKLLVPQSLCGIIIGRSGSTIRQFAADTQTTIKVTAADGPAPPLSHRIVTVAGQQEGVVKAIALLTLKMSEDHKFSLFSSLPVSGAGAGAAGAGPGPNGVPVLHSMGGMGMASPYGPSSLQPMPYLPMTPPGAHPAMYAAAAAVHTQMAYRPHGGEAVNGGGGGYTSLAISLTEEQGNFLLGHDGRGAADVAQASGVRVKVEKDVRPGSKGQYRKLVLSGPVEAVQFAQWLLGQRLAMATAAVAGYGNGAAMSGAGMLPPGYMQQQVAGTTYFQPLMAGPGGYSPQGIPAAMPAYSMPPQMQQMGAPPPPPPPQMQQQMRVVAAAAPLRTASHSG